MSAANDEAGSAAQRLEFSGQAVREARGLVRCNDLLGGCPSTSTRRTNLVHLSSKHLDRVVPREHRCKVRCRLPYVRLGLAICSEFEE